MEEKKEKLIDKRTYLLIKPYIHNEDKDLLKKNDIEHLILRHNKDLDITEAYRSLFKSIGISIYKNITTIPDGFYSAFKGSFSVPASIKGISPKAFINSPAQAIQINCLLKEIPDKFFSGCKNLEYINVSASDDLTKINIDAFKDCASDFELIVKNIPGFERTYTSNLLDEDEVAQWEDEHVCIK